MVVSLSVLVSMMIRSSSDCKMHKIGCSLNNEMFYVAIQEYLSFGLGESSQYLLYFQGLESGSSESIVIK